MGQQLMQAAVGPSWYLKWQLANIKHDLPDDEQVPHTLHGLYFTSRLDIDQHSRGVTPLQSIRG